MRKSKTIQTPESEPTCPVPITPEEAQKWADIIADCEGRQIAYRQEIGEDAEIIDETRAALMSGGCSAADAKKLADLIPVVIQAQKRIRDYNDLIDQAQIKRDHAERMWRTIRAFACRDAEIDRAEF